MRHMLIGSIFPVIFLIYQLIVQKSPRASLSHSGNQLDSFHVSRWNLLRKTPPMEKRSEFFRNSSAVGGYIQICKFHTNKSMNTDYTTHAWYYPLSSLYLIGPK